MVYKSRMTTIARIKGRVRSLWLRALGCFKKNGVEFDILVQSAQKMQITLLKFYWYFRHDQLIPIVECENIRSDQKRDMVID